MNTQKKALALFLILVFLTAAVSGCAAPVPSQDAPAVTSAPAGGQEAPSSQNSQNAATQAPAAPAVTEAPEPAIPPFSEDDLEFTDLHYENDVSAHIFRIVKNNGQAVAKVMGTASAKDASGNELGASMIEVAYVGPGQTSILHWNLFGVSGVASVDYDLECTQDTFFYPVLGDLTVETRDSGHGFIARITNGGECDALQTIGLLLFFDEAGQLVNSQEQGLGTYAGIIPAGMTLATEFSEPSIEYDHAELYINTYSDGSRKEPAPVSEKDLTLREIRGTWYDGTEIWYLIVTNDSSYDLDIDVNAVLRGADGTMIGASKIGVTALASGQTGITWLTFYKDMLDGEKVDRVDCTFLFNTEPAAEDARPFLTLDVKPDGKGVDVSVTNKGSRPAEYVQPCILYFDADGNCVGHSSDYVRDDDRVLKNGDTLTVRYESRTPFATVESYFLAGRLVK